MALAAAFFFVVGEGGFCGGFQKSARGSRSAGPADAGPHLARGRTFENYALISHRNKELANDSAFQRDYLIVKREEAGEGLRPSVFRKRVGLFGEAG